MKTNMLNFTWSCGAVLQSLWQPSCEGSSQFLTDENKYITIQKQWTGCKHWQCVLCNICCSQDTGVERGTVLLGPTTPGCCWGGHLYCKIKHSTSNCREFNWKHWIENKPGNVNNHSNSREKKTSLKNFILSMTQFRISLDLLAPTHWKAPHPAGETLSKETITLNTWQTYRAQQLKRKQKGSNFYTDSYHCLHRNIFTV